jgi:hypothetical protein
MHRIIAVGLLMAVAVSGSASAQGTGGHQGTKRDQDACGPDARRFCKADLDNDMKVLACLKDHERRLSNACHAVLAGYGQLPPRESKR